MDWVKQAGAAPDHELSYILRQCLIATEYTVRHLQWEETLQQRSAAHGAPRDLLLYTGGSVGDPPLPSRPALFSPLHGGRPLSPESERSNTLPRSGPGSRSAFTSPTQQGGGAFGSPSPTSPPPSSCSPQGSGIFFTYSGERQGRSPEASPTASGQCSQQRRLSSGCGGGGGGGVSVSSSPGVVFPGSDPAVVCGGGGGGGGRGVTRENTGSDSDSTLVSDGENFRSSRTSGGGGFGGDGDGGGTDGYRSCGSVSDAGEGVWEATSPSSRVPYNGERSPPASSSSRLPTTTSPGVEGVSASDLNTSGFSSSPGSSCYYRKRHVTPPVGASDVDYQLLHSGIAILPGSSDVDGRRLIFIFTCSVVWHQRQVVSSELTRLLMYYYSIPKRELVSQGVTIVVDVRGATSSTVNILLECLYLFKDNVPNSIAVIHMVADKPAQSLVLKSPVYDPQSGVTVDVLLSRDLLLRSVSLDQLPTALDGTFPYSHEEWVRFRMKLEPFLTNCCAVAQSLVGVMQEISGTDLLPLSAAATRDLLTRQEEKVKAAFSDPRLVGIQEDGEVIMSSLRREERSCCYSEDYQHAVHKVSGLYHQLQQTMSRLSQLAEERLQRLQQCLQLRGFEEECHKVLTWLQQEGQSLLERHGSTADNLKAVRGQQRDFEKLYFSAMTHIEKGNDLMEEAGTLGQSAAFSDGALGYASGARRLKQQLQLFTSQLEDTRERIEGTARCYSLLDKSYEWALEAMKYVASMRMEHCATACGLDKLLHSLEHYLQQHPPMSEETFLHMLDTAQRLHNDRLLEQCRVARARCQETFHLLLLRHNTLQRARDQLLAEHGVDSLGDVAVDDGDHHRHHDDDDGKDLLASEKAPHNLSLEGDSAAEAVETGGRCGEGGAANSARLVAGGPALSRSVLKSPKASGRAPLADLKSVAEEEDFPVWEPRTDAVSNSVGGVGEQSWSDSYTVTPSPQTSCLPAREDVADCSFSASSPCAVRDDRKVAASAGSLSAKPPIYTPSPTSPSSRLPSRPTPLSSPRQEKGEFKTPSGRGPSRLQLSRTISQPTEVTPKLPSSSSKPGPLKKILKRASTAPVPMMTMTLTSPGVDKEERPEPLPPRAGLSEVENKLGQRGDRTLSMITGSSDSLPSSMPEEEDEFPEGSLNISRCSEDSSLTKWTPVSVNSHLHSRTSPTGHMADLRLSGKKRMLLLNMSEMVQMERDFMYPGQCFMNYIPSIMTVLLIMSEMVQTERDYTRSLQYVIENYIPELQRVDVPQLLRGKRNVIFGNIEKLYQFHAQYFLRELETCEHNPFLVGHYFLRHEPEFHLYTLYNKNKPKSDDLMLELGKQFFRQKQLELGDRMDLASYLLKPVQRMGKYALLLKQILKECPETEPEYADLKAAEEMVRFQLRHGNDLLAMDSLRDVDVNLQEQGKLLRQDEFLVFQGRKKMMRQVFLFQDLILFSKTRRGRQGQHDIYVYKHSLKMADMGLTENCGDSGYKFEIWFRRRTHGDNYILQAPNSEVKRAWVKEISRILWHQAIKNRESHINEMASMGIGNKPCLDIQPSCDNINERSLNFSLSNKGARTRNSIAVSSIEYLRQSNKRPHSIISVSSNSSSNSSHSSLGLFGSLNLAFDPIDSPRHLHRQSMLSSESGIEVDHAGVGGGEGDPGGGKAGQQQQRPPSSSSSTPTSPSRGCPPGVLQPRALNQSFTEPIMTDV